MKKIIIPLIAILYSILVSLVWFIYATLTVILTLIWDFKFPNFYYRFWNYSLNPFESCFGDSFYTYRSYFHYIWNIKRKL